jgi:hypothetical protein
MIHKYSSSKNGTVIATLDLDTISKPDIPKNDSIISLVSYYNRYSYTCFDSSGKIISNSVGCWMYDSVNGFDYEFVPPGHGRITLVDSTGPNAPYVPAVWLIAHCIFERGKKVIVLDTFEHYGQNESKIHLPMISKD